MNTVVQPADRAIVVGINRYPNLGEVANSKNLSGPVPDAEAMAAWLVNVAGAHVTLITSKGTGGQQWTVDDLRPTRGDVEPALNGLISESIELQRKNLSSRLGRRLYVYMAGHGFSPEPRTLALITADAFGDVVLPNIEAPAWIDWFSDQYHFDELILWMDCCATRMFDYDTGKPLLKKFAARASGRAKVFIGFAASPGTDTYEMPFGPQNEVRGIFTERLLRGLNGSAADENNEVTTSSLIKFMQNSSAVVGTTTTTTMSNIGPRAAFPEYDEMVLAKVDWPKYKILVPLADGVTVSIKKGNSTTAMGMVQNRSIEVALPSGLFTAMAPAFSKSFEIGSGGSNNVDLQ